MNDNLDLIKTEFTKQAPLNRVGFLFLALQDKRKALINTKNEGCLQKKEKINPVI